MGNQTVEAETHTTQSVNQVWFLLRLYLYSLEHYHFLSTLYMTVPGHLVREKLLQSKGCVYHFLLRRTASPASMLAGNQIPVVS